MNHPIFSYYLQGAVLRRMSVAEFAAALGHSDPILARSWVSGEALPPITELHAISRVLGVDPIEMLMIWSADNSAFSGAIVKAEKLDPRGSDAQLSGDRKI